MTSAAFGSVFDWFPLVLMVALLLFGYSTVVSWSFYGLKSWTYLFGHSDFTQRSFKVLFCSVVAIGAVPNMLAVFDFIDSMNLFNGGAEYSGLVFVIAGSKAGFKSLLFKA